MILKQSKPPSSRRRFDNPWSELKYLCAKVDYWLHVQPQKARAMHYRGRLERVLRTLAAHETAILREEGLALLYELKGDLGKAISHRSREIELMGCLNEDVDSHKYTRSTRAYLSRDRDASVLANRQARLDALLKARSHERARTS